MKNTKSGSSLIEVILAVGIFVIIISGSIGTVLQGFGLNRRSEEQNIATQYATEGLEAARSIRNQNYYGLTYTSSSGLTQSGGLWTLSGTNNQFGPNNKFTRTLQVEAVYRDSIGAIVSSGGNLDGKTKKVTSTVAWDFAPTINNSVVLSTYLTGFQLANGTPASPLIYGVGTTTPQYRLFDPGGNSFSAEAATVTGGSPQTLAVKVSPALPESIAGYVTSGGTLYVLCFDGTTWTNEWNVSVGGTGNTRRFDIAYEKSTGDVVVLYSTNTATTNELAFRTKTGTSGCGTGNWSGATSFDPIRTSGTVQWVKMVSDRQTGSSLLAATWADSNSDLSAAIWSGSGWTNEPTDTSETSLEIISAAQDVDDFDIEYETLSGDVMLVWANSAGDNGTNGVRYRTCTGGTSACTWSSVTTPPTFSDDAHNLDLAANQTTNELVFASIGDAGNDLQAGYWSGSAWTNQANIDTSTTSPIAGGKKIATGWLTNGATNRSIITYDDQGSSNVNWIVGDTGIFTTQADFNPTPSLADQGTHVIEVDPADLSQLLLVIADANNDLFAKRLVMTGAPAFTWTDSDGGVALETTLPQNISYPFAIAIQPN